MKLTDKQKLTLFTTTNSIKIQPYLDLYEDELITFEDFSKKVVFFADSHLNDFFKHYDENIVDDPEDEEVIFDDDSDIPLIVNLDRW